MILVKKEGRQWRKIMVDHLDDEIMNQKSLYSIMTDAFFWPPGNNSLRMSKESMLAELLAVAA